MSKRLFVAGFPWATTESDLRELFGGIGEVTDVSIVTDKDTGRSRGFGFVEMAEADEADEAIKQINDTEMGGRTLKVDEAKARARR